MPTDCSSVIKTGKENNRVFPKQTYHNENYHWIKLCQKQSAKSKHHELQTAALPLCQTLLCSKLTHKEEHTDVGRTTPGAPGMEVIRCDKYFSYTENH